MIMRKAASFALTLVMLSLMAAPAMADEVKFHDAKTKFYNDNGFPKQLPESPLTLSTTFSVDEQKQIFFILEPSNDNMPYAEPKHWRVRLKLINDTWSYTDLGVFGDGADLTAPTNPLTVSPGYNYTLEMMITFTEERVTTTEGYEISVDLGVKTGSGYEPSDSISHVVYFSEEPTVPPAKEESPPYFLIFVFAIIVGWAVLLIRQRRKKREEED